MDYDGTMSIFSFTLLLLWRRDGLELALPKREKAGHTSHKHCYHQRARLYRLN